MRRAWFCAILLFAIAVSRAAMCSVPPGRIDRLKRGVNLSGWLSQLARGQALTESSFKIRITDADLELIRNSGFDHVRLCVDPDLIGDRFSYVDRAVEMILKHGLAVVVDAHPDPERGRSFMERTDSLRKFASFWAGLAGSLRRFPPDRVFLEILNEPELTSNTRKALGILASTVRKEAPDNTLIAAGFSAPEDLMAMKPLRDPDMIYDFHFYLPGIFTHQGADWAVPYYRGLKGIPYPLSPRDGRRILSSLTSSADRAKYLATYGSRTWRYSIRSRSWDAARIDEVIAGVSRWAKKFHQQVICEEFGVYPPNADPAARYRWLADVRAALEKRMIGWAVWDYKGSFAIARGAAIDPGILNALGLPR